jgi:7-cyano-7-deazaguanine synthase
MKKKAVVIHSGGMDSSLCLALAIREFGAENVLSLSFSYNQRHSIELQQAARICFDWSVDHTVLNIDCLEKITKSALIGSVEPIHHRVGQVPNTIVIGRNGLMAHIGGIQAQHLGARCIYMGVIEVDGSNSGYRDCSRYYMDFQEQILRIDLDDSDFEIRTPLVKMSKKETMDLGYQFGVLEYLLCETVTCYEGIKKLGCGTCPACHLRNEGIKSFLISQPQFIMPYSFI